MATLTAANSIFRLSITGLYTASQTIQGYGVDDAFGSEAVEFTETPMGVDGIMSAAYVPVVTNLKVVLQPDSPSIVIFDNWAGSIKAAREVSYANATILLPGTGKKYTLSKGVLTQYMLLPDVKKILQPVPYRITFQDVSVAGS